jgi:hypothetical protein
MPRVFPESAMKYLWTVAAFAFGANASQAQDGVDKAKASAFDSRIFGGPLSQRTYACFVRRYDANHLAPHPKQRVSAMKLLVTAQDASNDLVGGADDRIFRVDRADLHGCSGLVTDRKQLATLRRK